MTEIGEHLRKCEESLLDPAIRRDRTRVERLLAEDFEEFGSSGRVWSRDAIFNLLETESYIPPVIEEFHCTMLSDSVALVTYKAVRRGIRAGERTETLRSSIWIRKQSNHPAGEEWILRFHQGTNSD